MGLPTGTLTFLFSDIEGSTRLWETEADAMERALVRHDDLLRDAIESSGGAIVKTTGDGVHAVFEQPGAAIDAAVAMQRACTEAEWPTSTSIRIRVGLHTGESQLRDGDYYGPTLNRAARIMAAAHGGQTVCSAPTAELARDTLADDVSLVDLGRHRLRDLARAEQVFQVTHPDLPRDFPELRSIDTLPGNLPVQPNRFVGRDDLIAEIAALLDDARVVTISGPGGVGKTRLALQVAVAVQPEFPEGAWFIDLASVTDPDLVAAQLLETLEYVLADGEDPIEGLCNRLRRRRMLIVLDNCEHVVAGAAALADAISKSADDVRLLATSREGLAIPAEQHVALPPLDTTPEGDAVRLFVTRAQAARRDFEFGTHVDAVVELCRRLDGIPLAIELAAARTRAVSPEEILERLDQRFRILKGSERRGSERHQTLQAAIDWSYDLLTPDEQTVLDRLAVFEGGWTLDAAEQIVSDDDIDEFEILDYLDALVDKSLVVPGDTDRGVRYRLLETIRQYSTDHLDDRGDAETLREQHALYYANLAVRTAPRFVGHDEVAEIARLDADVDNIRAMLDWHLDHGRAEKVGELLARIEGFIQHRDCHMWALPRLDRCLDAPINDASRSVAHAARAWLRANLGYPGVRADVDAARASADRAGIPAPLMALAAESVGATLAGDAERACELADRLAELGRDRDEFTWFVHGRTQGLAFRCLVRADDPDLVELADRVREEIDPWWHSPYTRDMYLFGAALAHVMFDPPEALRLLEEKRKIASAVSKGFGVADSEFFIALMQLGLGEAAAAAESCRRALIGHHDVGMRRGILMSISGAAGIAIQTGHTADAVTILAGLRGARRKLDAPGSQNEQYAEERVARRIARDLGDDVLDRVEPPDLEATIDLTLAMLDAVANDPALRQ